MTAGAYWPRHGDLCRWLAVTGTWRVVADVSDDDQSVLIQSKDRGTVYRASVSNLRPAAQTRLGHRRRPCP